MTAFEKNIPFVFLTFRIIRSCDRHFSIHVRSFEIMAFNFCMSECAKDISVSAEKD
jgi:hypothetical protein